MTEKRYYVRSNSKILASNQYLLKRAQVVIFIPLDPMLIPNITNPKLGKEFQFTKSELGEVEDGKLYKRVPFAHNQQTGHTTGWRHVSDDDSMDDEWINPLIKLVPVDEANKNE